jgi:hypothetical protein
MSALGYAVLLEKRVVLENPLKFLARPVLHARFGLRVGRALLECPTLNRVLPP